MWNLAYKTHKRKSTLLKIQLVQSLTKSISQFFAILTKKCLK